MVHACMQEAASFQTTLNLFLESDNFDAILHIDGKVEEEFVPSGNMRSPIVASL
jgi:hypothetical protein